MPGETVPSPSSGPRKRADRRTKFTDSVPAKELQSFQHSLAAVVLHYKGDALATAFIDHVVDAVVSALVPIVRLPDDLDEAAAIVKGWIVKPATLPKCAIALGGPNADLLRRTKPGRANSPISKKSAVNQETSTMLSTAFPVDVNQQAGWAALGRIHHAYARLARSIRPSILYALRDVRIGQGEDHQPLLCHIATMCE